MNFVYNKYFQFNSANTSNYLLYWDIHFLLLFQKVEELSESLHCYSAMQEKLKEQLQVAGSESGQLLTNVRDAEAALKTTIKFIIIISSYIIYN